MASEDIAKLAETLAKTQVAGGQLSFKGKSLKLNTAEDGEFLLGLAQGKRESVRMTAYSYSRLGLLSSIIMLFS